MMKIHRLLRLSAASLLPVFGASFLSAQTARMIASETSITSVTMDHPPRRATTGLGSVNDDAAQAINPSVLLAPAAQDSELSTQSQGALGTGHAGSGALPSLVAPRSRFSTSSQKRALSGSSVRSASPAGSAASSPSGSSPSGSMPSVSSAPTPASANTQMPAGATPAPGKGFSPSQQGVDIGTASPAGASKAVASQDSNPADGSGLSSADPGSLDANLPAQGAATNSGHSSQGFLEHLSDPFGPIFEVHFERLDGTDAFAKPCGDACVVTKAGPTTGFSDLTSSHSDETDDNSETTESRFSHRSRSAGLKASRDTKLTHGTREGKGLLKGKSDGSKFAHKELSD